MVLAAQYSSYLCNYKNYVSSKTVLLTDLLWKEGNKTTMNLVYGSTENENIGQN